MNEVPETVIHEHRYNYRIASLNPLNATLNPIFHLLALLGAHHILHVSKIKVNVCRLVVMLHNCHRNIRMAFILVINQLDAQNLFYNKFISCLHMFRAPCAHRQEVKIVLYSLWYHHSCEHIVIILIYFSNF